MKPLISCIMSNYNTQPEMLRMALDSILEQTLEDFELILIDDKSTDKESKYVVDEYAQKDTRVLPIYNQENMGLAGALNIGLKAARGEYIARFDTDDICVKERFEKQLKYMREKDVDVCSGYGHLFGAYDDIVSTSFHSCEAVAAQLLFSCYIYHTPVMMRKSFLEQHQLLYDENFDGAEDFDLFARCRDAGARICIMPKVLFHYRIHSSSVCHTQKSKQILLTEQICRRQIEQLKLKYSEDEFNTHKILCGLNEFTAEEYQSLNLWCEKLIRINNNKLYFNEKLFPKVVYNRFLGAILKSGLSKKEKIRYILQNHHLLIPANLYAIVYKETYKFIYEFKR